MLFYEKVDEILDYLLTHSDFEFDEEELKDLDDQAMTFVTEELSGESKSLDTMSEKELQGYFGVATKNEVIEMIRINSEREIASTLIIADMHGLDVRNMTMDEVAGTYYSLPQIDEYLKEILTIKEER